MSEYKIKQNEQEIVKIAKICHAANRAYCQMLDDHSQVEWEHAEKNIQESAISGVRYALTHPGVTPKDQHENWMKFKQEEGWVYGETKDAVKKTHPCMVPYEQLPVAQQLKDKLFRAIVAALS